jgi:hypothetical protein
MPAESERLRKVSYEKQLKAGMRKPGRGGLTSDRLGDAEVWTHREIITTRDKKNLGGTSTMYEAVNVNN